jgi:hypothetical protein
MPELPASAPIPIPPLPQNLPLLYFNGFKMGISSADIGIRLTVDAVDVLELKCSFTSVKSFSDGLAKLVKQLEESTDHVFMTQNEIAAKLVAFSKKSPEKEAQQ